MIRSSLLCIFILLFGTVFSQVTGDFRSNGNGNWNNFSSWEIYDGSSWVPALSGQLPTSTSTVEILAGDTIIINATGLLSGNLNITGVLRYDPATVSALTVSGKVNVIAGGLFTSPVSGAVTTHSLIINGSLNVEGAFDMNVNGTAAVPVTFGGASNDSITGTGTINFYSLILNKGAVTSILEVKSIITIVPPAVSAIRLDITSGTFKLSSASVLSPYYGQQVIAYYQGKLLLNHASAVVQRVGSGTSAVAGRPLVYGVLQIDAGTFSYGSGNDVFITQATVILNGPNATMNIYGGVTLSSGSQFTMTAGNLNIYMQAANNYTGHGLSFESHMVMYNLFNFTGGTITIVDPSTSSASNAIDFVSGNLYTGNITYTNTGTIRLGDGVSNKAGSVNGFQIKSGVYPLGNLIVNNPVSSVLTTRLAKLTGATTINGDLIINGGTANQFALNGNTLTLNGNLTNAGTFNGDGNVNNTVSFSGTALQIVSGAGTFVNGNINKIIINNTSSLIPSVDLRTDLTVSNALTLTNGFLGTTTASTFTIGRSASSTSFAMTRSGGVISLVPVFSLTGVTTINYTYSAPAPAASITTGSELPASVVLTNLTINNVSGVTLDKPVATTNLALQSGVLSVSSTNTITVTGTTAGSVTGGSATAYVNGALIRTVPNNAVAGNYRFPVGRMAYQLFEFSSLTTGGTGTGTISVEAFDEGFYPGTPGTGLSTINTDKYWKLSASLGPVTINSASFIRLTDASLVAFNHIGQSSSATGTYNSIGGSISGGTISSVAPFDQSTLAAGTYFRIGMAGSFAAGLYAIGPQASYPGYAATFASALAATAAITNVPIGGNVIFEFQADYDPVTETFPIAFTANINSNATATVTFRPAPGIVSVINFTSAGTLISNTGADYITFDGRSGGAGTAKNLKFTSTSATVGAVVINNNSTNNKFLFCNFKGNTTAASTGVFTTGTTLNSPLTIESCTFDGSGLANSCLYISSGIPDISVKKSDFFDFRNGYGIYIPAGSNNAIVDSNNIYQTIAYNGFAGTTTGIYFIGITNGRISNNNIGGSGPGLTGTWTVNPTTPAAYNFYGINATSLTTGKVYNNKIQNIDWKCNAANWYGINTGGTSADIGTDGGNFIGDITGNNSIKITYFNNAAAQIYGIYATGNVIVENNKIGSITTLLSATTSTGSSFTGIYSTSTGIINNNQIGSTATLNSISTAPQSATGFAQNLYGIYCATTTTIGITNNIVANITNGSTVASGVTRGILVPANGSSVNISTNQIYSVASAQPVTGTGISSCLNGIQLQSSAATQLISANQVYDLNCTAASAAVMINGIIYSSSGTGVTKIERNLIHGLRSISGASIINGINISSGLCTLQNNVVRLGIDKDGNPLTNTAQINGIYKSTSSTGNIGIFHNTVYIGGSGVVASAVNTYAFNLFTHTNEDIRNNIFVNVRTNLAATPLHFCLGIPASVPSLYVSDYNIYHTTATDGGIAKQGATVLSSINSLLGALPGTNANSGSGDPWLTNPAAGLPLMSLIPQNFSPAEGNGVLVASVTDDYTGALRPGLTPTDIGAYAGNFTPPGPDHDIWFPVISYTPLLNTGSTADRTVNSFAVITDNFTGVNTTAGTKPRLYYKKSTDANAFAGNTSSDNGWKWVEATNSASPFSFVINYSIINGGTVSVGDIIQYYVVAQDNATTPNVSINPPGGASAVSVAPTGMTAPTVPSSYSIVPTLAAAIDVGTGLTYTSLTGTLASGGLFAAINAGVITSNIAITVKSNLTEPGTVGLNPVVEEGAGAGTYTITIAPDANPRVISGIVSPYTSPMIPINGASRVTFDGGVSKQLTIRNANSAYNTTGPVIQFNNGAQNCTITNCIIESNAYALQPPAPVVAAEVVIGTAGTNSVTISNNDFRDSRGAITGNPRACIFSNSVNNSLIITGNNIYNFKSGFSGEVAYGIYLNAVAPGCTIQNNSIYMETGVNPICGLVGIYVGGGNNHFISGNYIGGSAPLCSGTWNCTSTVSNVNTGIVITGGGTPASLVQNNVITGFNLSGTGYFTGIQNSSGISEIRQNTIGSATVADAIRLAGAGAGYGINVLTPTAAMNIDQNTIANVSVAATNFKAINSYGGNVRRNKIFSIGGSIAANIPTIYGIYNAGGFTSNEFSNNMISINGGLSQNPWIYGFWEASATGSTGFYYNSINVYGTALGTNSTYSFYRNANSSYTVIDNIFVNTRTGGTGKHYAISSAITTGFTSDYNDLYVAGTVFGRWGAADVANLAAWKAIAVVPPLDVNSITVNPAFLSNTDLHITSDPNIANKGITVPVTIDIDGVLRSSVPDLGINQFGVSYHTLNIIAFLEGFYAGAGTMNPATNFDGVTFSPKWGATIADTITVELHNTLNYAVVAHRFSNVFLNTNGTASVNIPMSAAGTYYLTIKHRNSIETVSALPVTIAGVSSSYNFSTAAAQSFGSNLKNSGGVYLIYSGDLTSLGTAYPALPVQDGVSDLQDLYYIYSAYLAGDLGYKPSDLNGDGVVDLTDLYLNYNNYLLGIYAVTP